MPGYRLFDEQAASWWKPVVTRKGTRNRRERGDSLVAARRGEREREASLFLPSLFLLFTVSSLRTAQYFPERRERAENGEEWGEGRR